jgi:hypothetical protein
MPAMDVELLDPSAAVFELVDIRPGPSWLEGLAPVAFAPRTATVPDRGAAGGSRCQRG